MAFQSSCHAAWKVRCLQTYSRCCEVSNECGPSRSCRVWGRLTALSVWEGQYTNGCLNSAHHIAHTMFCAYVIVPHRDHRAHICPETDPFCQAQCNNHDALTSSSSWHGWQHGYCRRSRLDSHLGGFATTSVTTNDCHIVLPQRIQQALPNLDHRQLLPLALPLRALGTCPPCLHAPQHVSAFSLLRYTDCLWSQ